MDDGMTMLSPLRPEDGGDGNGMNQSDSPPRMSREDTAHSLVRRVLGYVLFSKKFFFLSLTYNSLVNQVHNARHNKTSRSSQGSRRIGAPESD